MRDATLLFLVIFAALGVRADDDFVCPGENSQYPHPVYCDWYYNCLDYTATLLTCGTSVAFDENRKICRSMSSVNCGDRVYSWASSSSTSSDLPPDTTTIQAERTTTLQSNPDTTTILAGTTTLESNPDTTTLQSETTTNQEPETTTILQSETTTNQEPETTTTLQSETTTNQEPETTTNLDLSCPVVALDAACPEACGVFSVPVNCSDYVVCRQGVATLHTCPEGLLFDEEVNTCNKECRVNCEGPRTRRRRPESLRKSYRRWTNRRAAHHQ